MEYGYRKELEDTTETNSRNKRDSEDEHKWNECFRKTRKKITAVEVEETIKI